MNTNTISSPYTSIQRGHKSKFRDLNVYMYSIPLLDGISVVAVSYNNHVSMVYVHPDGTFTIGSRGFL